MHALQLSILTVRCRPVHVRGMRVTVGSPFYGRSGKDDLGANFFADDRS
jgi:hypothetical protein